jgi:hypothetical protein
MILGRWLVNTKSASLVMTMRSWAIGVDLIIAQSEVAKTTFYQQFQIQRLRLPPARE